MGKLIPLFHPSFIDIKQVNIMKKIILLATATLVFVAGCSKMDKVSNIEQDIKVNFTISEKPALGALTKAVKTDWAVGDKIVIALKQSSSENVLNKKISTSKTSYYYTAGAISLELTESGWTVNTNMPPAEGGTFYAIHHRGDISVIYNILSGTPENNYSLPSYAGGELLSFTGTYTVDSEGINLGTIDMKLDSRLMQISVPEELRSNQGNIYISECQDSQDMSAVISNPENTVKLSIYQNWTTSTETPVPLTNYVALRKNSVSIDYSDENLFVYNSTDEYKTQATPVMNDHPEYDPDYSFCFAYLAPESGTIVKLPTTYTFYIERVAEEEATYTIKYKTLYQTVTRSDDRTLGIGKAVRLSSKDWVAVTE